MDRHKDALQYYDTSLVIDPNDVTALMNKAISLSHLGNYQDAIDYYDLAQRVDSAYEKYLLLKSKLFEKLNMPDEAFLAAQGVLNKDMDKIKSDAKENKCSIFHQFCDDEFKNSNSK